MHYCSIPRTSSVVRLFLAGILGVATVGVHAQSAANKPISYHIPHASRAPVIDGVVAEGEWKEAIKVELTNETFPGQNVPAPVKTEVYLMEDGENFLVAFVADDPDPSKIRAFYSDRDRSFQDDFFGVVIDTFNDERRAFEIFMNPLGVQMDLTQDDVSKREDESWNALWDGAAQINEHGYVGEMKIPLKQLRLPSGLEKQTWGIDILRFWPRDTRHRISNNTMDYSVSCYLCQHKKLEGFGPVEQSTNLQLIPTLVANASENRSKPATDPWTRTGAEVEPSLDLRWGINEDMILNATLNPDFSQVEADQAQLDVNNTFSLFFPERREFFLDGADYFNTINPGNNNNNGGNNSLVYTRNINDPDYGVKLTGKSNNHTYALMAADDQRTGFLIPGNQGSSVATIVDTSSRDLALRYRYDLGRKVTLGTMVTDREATGYNNKVFDADFSWQVAPSDRIVTQVMHSSSVYPLSVQKANGQKPELSDDAWLLAYSHQGQNWKLNINETRYGEDFRADLGFIGRVNFREHSINPGYTWILAPGSWFNRVGVFTQWDKSWAQDDKELAENYIAGLFFQGKYQTFGELDVFSQQRFYNGKYFDLNSASFFGNIQPWAGARIGFNIRKGDAIDFANTRLGENFQISSTMNYQIGRHLQVGWQYTHQVLEVGGTRLFATDLNDLRLTWQFDNKSFIRAVLIHSDTERNPALYSFTIDRRSRSLSTQLLYSYRYNAQTRYFVGYSDSALEDASLHGLQANYRTVFAKFSYAWQY